MSAVSVCQLSDNILLVDVVKGSASPEASTFLDRDCHFLISITVSIEEIDNEVVPMHAMTKIRVNVV